MCAVRPDQAASSLSRELIMTIEHIETAIIGAGQAGLATAYYLQRSGRTCVILDGNRRVGDNWRAQWDSLRLYSPAGYDGLPGLPFSGSEMVLPDQRPGRRLPSGVRRAVRAPRADVHPGGPLRGGRQELCAPSRR